MFQLETPRLRLIPLKYDQLKFLLTDRHILEQELGLTLTDTALDEHFRDVLADIILPGLLRNPEQYIWLTEWQIVLKSENRIIGGFCFKGQPNETGEVEIGYGTAENYRNCGYTTEAIATAIDWAFQTPTLCAVIAETEKDNPASIRVLEKIGMQKYQETDDFYYWRVNRA